MKIYKNLKRPIIFIGTGRSGTTILYEMVCRHKHLAYASQYNSKYFKSIYINMLRLLFDNSLYRIHGQKVQLNKVSKINKFVFTPNEAYAMWDYVMGKEIDFSRGFLTDETLSDERRDFIRDYFNSMVKFQNRKRLVLKITGPSRISFLMKIFPDAIFINLKRNYIPTISSFMKVTFWKTRGMHKLWWTGVYTEDEKKWAKENESNGPLMTAFQLKKLNDIADLEVKKMNPKYIELYYEDFIKNPKDEINRVLEFTDLPSMDLDKQLSKVKIHNRNKKDSEYFNATEIKAINELLQTK